MTKPNTLYPTLAVIGAVILFATGGLAIKSISTGVSEPQTPQAMIAMGFYISGMRSLVATLFFAVYLTSVGRFGYVFRMSRWGWMTAVAFAMVMTCFVVANTLTTAANTIFLQSTMPAWVLIGGALFLGERITISRVASVVCCIAGMALFFQGELKPTDWLGNSIALLAGLMFAIVTLLFRYEHKKYPIVAVMAGNAITALVNLPLMFYLAPDGFSPPVDGAAIGCFLWLGIFQIGIAYVFYTKSLAYLPAVEVAILALLEPVLNPILVFFWLGERPSGWAIVGGAIILVSVMIRIVFVREIEPSAEP